MSKVMNHCHNCNTELPMEALFCNICGTRQAPAEPQSEAPAPTNEVTADTTDTVHCHECGAVLPVQALFCSACGSDQTPKAPLLAEPVSNEQEIPASTPAGGKALADSPQPASTKLLTPTRTIQPGARRRGVNNPLRPKTVARPLVYPARPTSSGAKSPAALPQHDPSQSTTSPQPLTSAAPLNSSSLAIQHETPKPTAQGDTSIPADPPVPAASANTEISSHTLSQSQEEPSTPARTPGIIRSVGAPPSERTIIPARPDPSRTTTAALQSEQAPSKQLSSMYDLDEVPTGQLSTEYTNGQNSLADEETMHLLSPESFAATSKAAEHWRKSWRDRQYAEGGPAKDVSRGHASVPSPLMAMQHSFARIRAIARANKQRQGRRNTNLSFWITIFLMICFVGGLGAYITSTYLPNSPLGATQVAPSANAPQPSLTIQGTSSATFEIGQTVHLHGEHFGVNDTITFLLDTTTPIVDASGNKITARATSLGLFNVAFTIGSDWATGSHSIEAIDSGNNQSAFLTMQVIPTGTPETTSTRLSITIGGKPIQVLKFTAVIGQGNTQPQRINITNTSGATLKWSAAASSGNNLSWLIINDNHTYGQLAISQTDTLLISVNIVGLKNTPKPKPYTGQIVFTINDAEQLTVPVQLQVANATAEMVFSPNPIIAPVGSRNTCRPGVTLTLINLGTEVISWAVNPDDNIQNNIKFVNPVNGQPKETGSLEPSGLDGDTQVLTLQCYNIQVGRPYHVSIYANGIPSSELVIVQ
jgi:ribosomal protein L40E